MFGSIVFKCEGIERNNGVSFFFLDERIMGHQCAFKYLQKSESPFPVVSHSICLNQIQYMQSFHGKMQLKTFCENLIKFTFLCV